MSFLNFFSGPSPEKLEENGDALFAAGHWGPAKLAYEGALGKRQKQSDRDIDARHRLAQKIREAVNALAREHRQTAQNLIEGGYDDEARALLASTCAEFCDRLDTADGHDARGCNHIGRQDNENQRILWVRRLIPPEHAAEAPDPNR